MAVNPSPARVNGSAFELTELGSGTRVITETMPEVRSVTLGWWVRVGSRDEDGPQAGASHFLEHLLFKGTEHRSAKQIAHAIDAVGGSMNAFTSREYTCFHAKVLDRDLDVAGEVLGDMIAAATIAEPDVEAERQVVLEEINIHLDSPEDLVHSDLAAILLDDHPLAQEVLGTPASIREMTRQRVYEHYDRWYRPKNLTVAAAGNVSHAEVVELADSLTDTVRRPAGQPPVRTAPDHWNRGAVGIRHRPTEQAHLAFGIRGLVRDDDRRFALLVLNTLLGGGMSSRLFQEIREQRGLAYSTYSYHAAHADGGWLVAYAGTTPSKADELAAVLRDQLDQLPDTITPEEVDRARGAVVGTMILGLEDTSSRMVRLGKMVSTDSELLTVEEALRRLEAVDVEAVRELAAQLCSRPWCLAVVGPFDPDQRDRFLAYVR